MNDARPLHLVLTTRFLPSGGGKEASTDRLSRAMSARGHDVEIIAVAYADQTDAEEFDRTYPLKVMRVRHAVVERAFRSPEEDYHGVAHRMGSCGRHGIPGRIIAAAAIC